MKTKKLTTEEQIADQIRNVVQLKQRPYESLAYRAHGEEKLIRVEDVIPYEKNPRIHKNEEYESIKQSIRERGLESRLFVCKRPGSDRWVLTKGGSTRLKILQELALELPDRFEEVMFVAVQHPGEAEMVAGHMVENISRGEMCFWDIAHGLKTLREQLVKDAGKELSNQAFLDKLSAMGLEKFTDQIIRSGMFALASLQALGPWQVDLKHEHVRGSLSPTFAELQQLWKNRSGTDRSGTGSFQKVIDQSISGCVSSEPEYSVDALLEAMREGVYRALRIESPDAPTVSSVQPDHTGDAAGPAGADDPYGSGEPDDPDAPDAPDAPDGSGDPDDSGYTVVKGKDVKPAPIPNRPSRKPRLNDPPGVGGGPLTPEELAGYIQYKGTLPFAQAMMREALVEFCEEGGLSHLITECDPFVLRYGLYMEIPDKPLTDLYSIPALVWWLAAYYLGQFSLVEVSPTAFKPGPGTWSDFIFNQESQAEIRERIFGGNPPDMAKMVGHVFMTRDHRLAGPMLELFGAMGDVDAKIEEQEDHADE